jgi:hypothetical protein
MGKSKAAKDTTQEAKAPARPDMGLIRSLSLLAGALATYPSLQGMVEGRVEPVRAATLFLVATLIALIGFYVVACLFRSFSDAHHATEDEKARAEAEAAAASAAGQKHGVDQDSDISTALADTDALVHGDRTTP